MGPAERAALLREAAEQFKQHAAELVELTIAETGALRNVAITQQVGAVVTRLGRFAELAATLQDETFPPREQPGPNGVALLRCGCANQLGSSPASRPIIFR
jgi:acyl-CoA reductase-like NAD-dependent aldehyde dehydrogenase